ncbi:MAG: SnoaL-like domain [Myxococcales bacterium]|nr:SnoaL-like domain [Myxococcales bacterium]
MSEARPPSRALLVIAGLLTQIVGVACLIAALAALPMVHDVHGSTGSVIVSVVAALAAIVCGTLVYRARLIPLALAIALDVGFGIVLPRGNSTIGALIRILPEGDTSTANTLVTVAAITMFVTGILCVLALPSALKVRRWARAQITRDEARDEREIGGDRASRPADTLKGIGQTRLTATQIVSMPGAPMHKRPLIIAGSAIALVVLGVVLIMTSTGSSSDPTAGSAASQGSAKTPVRKIEAQGAGSAVVVHFVDAGVSPVVGDAGVVASAVGDAAEIAVEPTPEDLLSAFHAALGLGDPAGLSALLDPKVFAFGPSANELAEGREAVIALLKRAISAPKKGTLAVEAAHTAIGRDAQLAWIAEEVSVGRKKFLATVVAGLHDGHWMIFALHWAIAMPNDTAYALARDGTLAVPDAIPNAHDESPLAIAMRTALASKPSFVEARSTRADAFNFGSALGERIQGGEAIKKTFTRIKATIHLHDAVKVGMIGDRGGWGAANVDFTDTDRDGNEVTQTFRVLAAWLHEDAGWRIVQTQWSNPR